MTVSSGLQVVGDGGDGGGLGEEEVDFVELAGGGLGVDVELADGFEFGIEEFEAEGAGGLEGEEIEDAAADGEVASGGDGGVALVAVGGEGFGKGGGIELGGRA